MVRALATTPIADGGEPIEDLLTGCGEVHSDECSLQAAELPQESPPRSGDRSTQRVVLTDDYRRNRDPDPPSQARDIRVVRA